MLGSLLVFLWFVLCLVPYKKISSKKFARFIHGKERGMTITMKKNSRLSKSRQFILLEMVFFLHTGIIGAVYTLYLLSLGLSLFEANAISAIFNIAQTVDKVLRETSVSRSIFLCVYEIYSENRKFSLGLCHP